MLFQNYIYTGSELRTLKPKGPLKALNSRILNRKPSNPDLLPSQRMGPKADLALEWLAETGDATNPVMLNTAPRRDLGFHMG